MPKENTFTKYNDYAKENRLPVVMYADFESSLENYNDEKRKYITKKHVSNSYRLIIKSDVDLGIKLEYSYVGKDTDINFVKLLSVLNKFITNKLKMLQEKNNKLKIKLSDKETMNFFAT